MLVNLLELENERWNLLNKHLWINLKKDKFSLRSAVPSPHRSNDQRWWQRKRRFDRADLKDPDSFKVFVMVWLPVSRASWLLIVWRWLNAWKRRWIGGWWWCPRLPPQLMSNRLCYFIMLLSNYRWSQGLEGIRASESPGQEVRRGLARRKEMGIWWWGGLLMRWTRRMEKVKINQGRKKRRGWLRMQNVHLKSGGGKQSPEREREREIRAPWIEKRWQEGYEGWDSSPLSWNAEFPAARTWKPLLDSMNLIPTSPWKRTGAGSNSCQKQKGQERICPRLCVCAFLFAC